MHTIWPFGLFRIFCTWSAPLAVLPWFLSLLSAVCCCCCCSSAIAYYAKLFMQIMQKRINLFDLHANLRANKCKRAGKGEMAGILAGLLLIYWRVRYPPQFPPHVSPPPLSNMCTHILNLSHSNNNNNIGSGKKQARAGQQLCNSMKL